MLSAVLDERVSHSLSATAALPTSAGRYVMPTPAHSEVELITPGALRAASGGSSGGGGGGSGGVRSGPLDNNSSISAKQRALPPSVSPHRQRRDSSFSTRSGREAPQSFTSTPPLGPAAPPRLPEMQNDCCSLWFRLGAVLLRSFWREGSDHNPSKAKKLTLALLLLMVSHTITTGY
jgi:hypothetical protein